MSGKSPRVKGRRGESAFALMLGDRDYAVIDTTAGKSCCDLVAVKDDRVWAFEVKDRVTWDWTAFYKQAHANAKKMRWALALHIPRTSDWLVLRQGEPPEVWR